MRLFSDDSPWDQVRKDLRYTRAALLASEEHVKFAKVPTEQLDQWNKVEHERVAAEDAVVDAQAQVDSKDFKLDRKVADLASRLRYEFSSFKPRPDEHPTFRAFFPENPTEVIRLGLENEIEVTKKFAVVARELTLSKEVQAILKEIAAVEAEGTEALAKREAAAALMARVSIRVATWKENANGARRSIENVLDAHATQHNLPRDYPDAFFPAATRKPPKKSSDKPVDPPKTP